MANSPDNIKWNKEIGEWEPAVPLPYFPFFPWLWKRLTGWRDSEGRKAELVWGWWF